MTQENSDEYLEAFLDGFEFVLMALEGRMDLMDEAAAEELAPFLEDYRRLHELLREKGIRPKPRIRSTGRTRIFQVKDLEASLRN